MVREVVCVHVGQCGLQLGSSFWHSLTTEHSAQQQRAGAGAGKAAIGGGGGGGGLSAGRSSAAAPQRSAADRSSSTGEWWRWSAASPSASASASASSFSGGLSTFFQPVDSATASSSSALSAFPYRARAVLVDMESGVLSALSRSSQSSLFDSAVCVVSDVSGSGNNWAHGYCVFGPQYGEAVLESVRRQAEACDSLQAFVMTHSTGGGTGSGLGSYVLELLSDEYAGVYRIDQCVLPSLERDDVVTSPYNAALSLPTVCRSADVVLPVDNQALVDACDAFHKSQPSAAQTGGAHTAQSKQRTARDASAPQVSPRPAAAALIGGGFSELNVLCAGVLSSLTAGMRFPGDLNVDLSDLVMNCCPFTDTNLLVPALSPLHHILSAAQHSTPGSSSSGGAEHTVASSRRAVSGANSGERGRGTTAVPVSTAEAPSYYFHTLSTAQSLYSTQSSARHAPPAFGSSTRLSALRGAVEGSQSGRAGSAQEDALFQAALHKSNQLLQVRHSQHTTTLTQHSHNTPQRCVHSRRALPSFHACLHSRLSTSPVC